MNHVAESRTHAVSAAASYALPILLALNTFALLTLDSLGQIPTWVKSAVAFFLSF